MWRQRSRVAWLKDGNKNTSFFHTKATQRRRRNSIKGLFEEAGQWCTNQNQIVDIAVNYYQHLFTSSNPDNLEEVLAEIPQKVTEEMNEALTALFTAEEVEKALKQMEPLKSPGPDGMPPVFFQSYWSLVGSDVLKFWYTPKIPWTLFHYSHSKGKKSRTYLSILPNQFEQCFIQGFLKSLGKQTKTLLTTFGVGTSKRFYFRQANIQQCFGGF